MSISPDNDGHSIIAEQQSDYLDDLLQNKITVTSTINAANSAGGSQKFNDTFDTVDPLGPRDGLARGEVAELVGVHFMGGRVGWNQQTNQGTTPPSVNAETLGILAEPGVDNTTEQTTVHSIEENGGTGNTMDVSVVEAALDPQAVQLWNVYTATGGSFNDTTNGTGGGGGVYGFYPNFRINFRKEFGLGPLIFWDESVELALQTEVTQFENSNLVFASKWAVNLYWDIYEEKDSGTTRLTDVFR